jgi:hypothetical protein
VQRIAAFLALLGVVAVLPVFAAPAAPERTVPVAFPGWPKRFLAPRMTRLPLSPMEHRFAQGFPGRIAKFSDAKRRFIVRFVAQPTRRLHPAADCFRSSYRVRPLPRCPAGTGVSGGCFVAEREEGELLVHESITDATGQVFGDVSAWYWATMQGVSQGPWWSITTISATPNER